MPELSGLAALAGRVRLPEVRHAPRLARPGRPVAVRRLCWEVLRDGGHDLPPHTQAADCVVRCRVAAVQLEDWRLGR